MSATTRSGLRAPLAASDRSAPATGPTGPFTVLMHSDEDADDLASVLAGLTGALAGLPLARVLFVDDSTDGIDKIIRTLTPMTGLEIEVLHRDSPTGGYGGAIAAGLAAIRTPWCVVLGTDVRYPPELVPALVAEGEHRDAQLVVGSRYRGARRSGGEGRSIRTLISSAGNRLARLAFPRILSGITDPLSGVFAIRRDLWESARIEPDGRRILLELAVRTRPTGVAELPCAPHSRPGQGSRAGLRGALRYVRHLTVLRASDTRTQMLAFGLIGASGVLPNLAVTWALLRWTGTGYVAAAILANQAAMLWNFLLIDLLLYHHRRSGHWVWRLGSVWECLKGRIR